MAWGALTEAQQILIRLYMLGGPQYKAQMIEAGAATGLLSKEQEKLALSQARVNQRTFLQNQALFTARRLLFYTSLGVLGLGAVALKMGFQYNSAMQTASVALSPVIKGQQALNSEMNTLFRMTALTPFQFKDTTTAFRTMYAGFKPLGLSIHDTNQTIQALTDALSYAGKATPASLNRVSVALLHMAYMGRPAGQTIIQLARDSLPIYAALNKELGLTEDQMRSISGTGITAQQVIAALNKYIEQTPGFMHAAMRQANLTLQGSFTTFKDLLSQAVGTSETGVFGWLHKTLYGINQQLFASIQAGKPVTITMLADAIDKQLSPKTHTVLNLFIFLQQTVKSLINFFTVLFNVVTKVVGVFDKVTGAVGGTHTAAKLLGAVLGTLIGLFLLSQTVMFGFKLAAEAVMFALWPLKALIWLITVDLEAFALKLLYLWDEVKKIMVSMQALNVVLWENPYVDLAAGIVILIVVLVILYFKWKAFHDAVNNTYKFIKNNWWFFHSFFEQMLGPLATMIESIKPLITLLGAIERIMQGIVSLSEKIAHSWVGRAIGAVASTMGGLFGVGLGIPGKLAGAGAGGAGSVFSYGRYVWPLSPQFAGGYLSPINDISRIAGLFGGKRGSQHVTSSPSLAPVGGTQGVQPTDISGLLGGANQQPINVNLVVDRQVLAKAVARAKADQAARR